MKEQDLILILGYGLLPLCAAQSDEFKDLSTILQAVIALGIFLVAVCLCFVVYCCCSKLFCSTADPLETPAQPDNYSQPPFKQTFVIANPTTVANQPTYESFKPPVLSPEKVEKVNVAEERSEVGSEVNSAITPGAPITLTVGSHGGKSKVAINRRQRGLSYGRLDTPTQERIQSVRLQASQLNLAPIKPKIEDNDMVSQLTTNSENNTEVEKDKVKDKDEVRKRIRKIAKGAGGGIYSTGEGTAKLGHDIIDGFNSLRMKKLDLNKIAEQEKININGNGAAPSATTGTTQKKRRRKKPKTEQEKVIKTMAPGKDKLHAFLSSSTKESKDLELDSLI